MGTYVSAYILRKKFRGKQSRIVIVAPCSAGPAEEVGLRTSVFATSSELAFSGATGTRHPSKCFTCIKILVTAWGGGTIILQVLRGRKTETQEVSHLPVVL